MFRTTALISLAIAVALMAGCNKKPQTFAEALEAAGDQTVGEAIEASGKPILHKYKDPREGYTPKKSCFVPPCDHATTGADKAAKSETPAVEPEGKQ